MRVQWVSATKFLLGRWILIFPPGVPVMLKDMKIPSASVLAVVLQSFPAFLIADDGFQPMFNGRNLEGWTQHSGTAEYRVEGDAIVGKTVSGTGNSFLCSNKTYGDFILEFEFQVAEGMNSGVQFRSEIAEKDFEIEVGGKGKKIPADRVYGYQYEIDPSSRAYTGGVYDEARRGWLFELKDNEAARVAFVHKDWNKARIECRGDHIQTWINGVKAAELHDSMTLRGVVALQVHGIGKDKQPGEEIRWRSIRIKQL
jgi:hypothetical protein